MMERIPIRTIIVVYFFGLAAGSLAATLANLAGGGIRAVFLSYALTQAGFLIAVTAYCRAFLKKPVFKVVPASKPVLKALPLTVAVTAGVYMQNLLPATGVSELLNMLGVYSDTVIPDVTDPLNAALAVVTIAALPAVAEETLFRGLFACSSYKSRFFMLFYSATLFSLGHLSFLQTVHQFILGAILAYLVYATGTVWYSVIIHFLNNVMALFTALIPGYAAALDFGSYGAWLMPVMCVAGAAILYPSLFALVKTHSGGAYRKGDAFFAVMLKRGESDWYAVGEENVSYDCAETVRQSKADKLSVVLAPVFLALMTVINTILTVKGVGQ